MVCYIYTDTGLWWVDYTPLRNHYTIISNRWWCAIYIYTDTGLWWVDYTPLRNHYTIISNIWWCAIYIPTLVSGGWIIHYYVITILLLVTDDGVLYIYTDTGLWWVDYTPLHNHYTIISNIWWCAIYIPTLVSGGWIIHYYVITILLLVTDDGVLYIYTDTGLWWVDYTPLRNHYTIISNIWWCAIYIPTLVSGGWIIHYYVITILLLVTDDGVLYIYTDTGLWWVDYTPLRNHYTIISNRWWCAIYILTLVSCGLIIHHYVITILLLVTDDGVLYIYWHWSLVGGLYTIT